MVRHGGTDTVRATKDLDDLINAFNEATGLLRKTQTPQGGATAPPLLLCLLRADRHPRPPAECGQNIPGPAGLTGPGPSERRRCR